MTTTRWVLNALHDNSVGDLNNAVGSFALEYNTTGNNNNAIGYGALLRNSTGSDNSALGYEALASNTTGNLNIAIGYQAGHTQDHRQPQHLPGQSGRRSRELRHSDWLESDGGVHRRDQR